VSPDGEDGSSSTGGGSPASTRRAQHRYGIVLALTILAVLFSILAPDTPVGRAVAIVLQGAMLFAVIVTSREGARDERGRDLHPQGTLATLTVVGLFALAALVALNVVPRWVGSAATAAALAVVLVVLTRGIVALVRARGVTVQAVAGALTTYLLIGLEFALVIRVIVGLSPHPYFGQVANATVTQSQEIYFSFTTLTTTGYGDLSPVLSLGRALSVLEMLVGQIYLVTVIGLLVGNLRRSSERAPEA
jgi:hypothetical protein